MGKLLTFLREYLDLRRESKSYCKSCETLREQLNVANHEKKVLLDQILYKPEKPVAEIEKAPVPITPKIVPWKVQREILEAEDRAKAKIIRQQQEEYARAQISKNQTSEPIENSSISVEQLEKELEITNG